MSIENNMFPQIKKSEDTEPEETMADNQENYEPTEEEKKLDYVEEFINRNYEQINRIAEELSEKFGININIEEIDEDELRSLAIDLDKAVIKGLELGSLIDKRIMAISILLIPLARKEIEINERIIAGEKIKTIGKIKEIAEIFLPEDTKIDFDSMDKAGDMIDNLANTLKGRKAIVVKMFAKLLKNNEFQTAVSGKFRKWLEENKENGEDIEDGVKEIIENELAE